MDTIIDTYIKNTMMLHDILHGFRMGKGTGTAIMELKLAQELDRLEQNLLILVFL